MVGVGVNGVVMLLGGGMIGCLVVDEAFVVGGSLVAVLVGVWLVDIWVNPGCSFDMDMLAFWVEAGSVCSLMLRTSMDGTNDTFFLVGNQKFLGCEIFHRFWGG